jgi:predicted PurR-regulated permease PerM
VLAKLEEIKNFKQDIKWTLETLLTESNYDILLKFIANIKSAWLIMIEFVIALILSFVFIIDRIKIQEYLKEVKKWNFAFLYNEYAVIFGKISNWFWLIFKAQSLISMVNTVLTIIGLYFIAFVHWATTFPYIFTLAIIVFIFWMIPVLWMILSAVPMIMIWFSFWWIPVVIEIILMVTVIHMIEAYYLNPRIVSSYAELPISLTFLILVLSEQFVWFAWLLIWVPIFYIIIDVMKDFDVYITKVRKAYAWIHIVKSETKKSLESDIRLSRSWKRSINISEDDL